MKTINYICAEVGCGAQWSGKVDSDFCPACGSENVEVEKAEVAEEEKPYDGAGFPGDGSGTDDFADFNANEANDYMNE